MDTKEYIESGVLELYVSGLLSVEEMRDVELKACQFPEVKTELASLQTTVESFVNKYSIAPRPELKDKIMRSVDVVAGKSDVEQRGREIPVRELKSSKPNYSRLLAAASIALIAVISAVAVYFASQYNNTRDQLVRLESQQVNIQKQMEQMQLAMNTNADNLQLLRDTSTLRIKMKGTAQHPESIAMIYWNKQTKEVYLDIKSLPPAPAGKQYQLWFIDPTNKPVSAGVFDVKTGEIMRMISAPAAVAFAVTLEPSGGSVSPTMDQMYVIGTVNS